MGYINIQARAIRGYAARGQADMAASGLERLGRVGRYTRSDGREYSQSMRGDAEREISTSFPEPPGTSIRK